MSKNITIEDVAEALGVSKTTVSRAISGKGRIGKETRERVLTYIEEHDYQPNLVAKGLAQQKTYNLCIVIPEYSEVTELSFFQDCLFGIGKISGAADYDMLLSVCDNHDLSSLERIIANRKADGVILMRTYMEDKQIEFLQEKGIPFVTIGSSDYAEAVQIDHDHLSACRELTGVLLLKGLSHVALIGGEEGHVVTKNRYAGYVQAFQTMGKQIEPELVRIGMMNPVLVDKAVREVVEAGADAIICMDDAVAGSVLRSLAEMRISVPGQMKVAAFYNGPLLNNYVPAVTALSFDAREIGMVACQTLLDMLDGIQVEKKHNLPYEIVLKESTQ